MGKRVPIDAYCEKKIATLQKSEDCIIDYVDISSVDNTEKKIISFQTMNAKDAPSRAKQLLKKDDIIVSTVRPNLNAVAVVESETDNLMVGSTGYCVLRCKDNMDFRYLFNFCQSQYFIDDMSSQATGASYPAVSTAIVRSSLIPCYPVDEQRKIASELDKITDLIDKRKEQLEKLDALVKARFVELFGDPVTNPKGWDMPLIENVVANEKNALKAGPFGSALKKEYYVSSGYKIYGQEQVISGDHTFGDYYIDEERYKMLENCAVQAGDVLISLVGTYGKLLVMPEEFEPGIINPRLMKITFDKKRVNPYYFQHYFQSDSLKKALAENTHGGTMDILNLGIVRKLAMPLPPLALQNEFISFVEQTDKSKLEVKKSLEKLELLKKALMQKYFG